MILDEYEENSRKELTQKMQELHEEYERKRTEAKLLHYRKYGNKDLLDQIAWKTMKEKQDADNEAHTDWLIKEMKIEDKYDHLIDEAKKK